MTKVTRRILTFNLLRLIKCNRNYNNNYTTVVIKMWSVLCTGNCNK